MSSEYIKQERRTYSLYVITDRALPAITDGLKPAGRRLLWTARGGSKIKSASLAGATLPIHPHAPADGVINTLTGPYVNNIPLFDGSGAFGTLLNPTEYGASRYTSVKISSFTKQVIFKDIELIPMQPNYDGLLEEPVHFLPLVPVSLVNQCSGIAVGFSCDILPRSLESIINAQIKHLQDKKFKEPTPTFTPIDSTAQDVVVDKNGNEKWTFFGEYKKINSTTIQITKFPAGLSHKKLMDHLLKLADDDKIVDFDDFSNDIVDIKIKFKRSILENMNGGKIIKLLNLSSSVTEHINVLDFDGNKVRTTNFTDIVTSFTDWRLAYYKTRYERLAAIIEKDIQKYKDILLAIKQKVGAVAVKTKSRVELKEFLEAIGIVNIDYIADLAIYRFTQQEAEKTQTKLDEAIITLKEYNQIIKSPEQQKLIYIKELRQVLKEFK